MSDFTNIAAYALFILAGVWALATVTFGIRGAIRSHRRIQQNLLRCDKPLVIYHLTID